MKALIYIALILMLNVITLQADVTEISILIRKPNMTPLQFTCQIEGKSLKINTRRYVYINSPNDLKLDLEWIVTMGLNSVPYLKLFSLLRESPAEVGGGGLDVPAYEIRFTEKGVLKRFNFYASDDTLKLPVMKEMMRVVEQLIDLSQIRPRKIFEFKSLEK